MYIGAVISGNCNCLDVKRVIADNPCIVAQTLEYEEFRDWSSREETKEALDAKSRDPAASEWAQSLSGDNFNRDAMRKMAEGGLAAAAEQVSRWLQNPKVVQALKSLAIGGANGGGATGLATYLAPDQEKKKYLRKSLIVLSTWV